MFNKNCKRCGKAFTITPDSCCPTSWSEKLSNLVTLCQRCSDFGWARSRIRDALWRQCFTIRNARQKPCPTESELKSAKSAAESVSTLCKTFATLCAKFYGKSQMWDDDFPRSIIDNPLKTDTIISVYERSYGDRMLRHITSMERIGKECATGESL